MKANYVPLEDRIVVSIPKEENQTESGIYLGDVKTNPYQEVIVESVGDGVKSNGQRVNMFVVPGQRVVTGKHTGGSTEYTEGGKTFRLLRQEDILFTTI